MALGLCRFTNAAGGVVDWTYPGPAIDMQSPTSAGAVNGTTYQYYAQSLDMSQWEIGTGAYTAATGVFARTTVQANSLGTTAKINFSNPPQIVVFAASTLAAIATSGSASDLISGTIPLARRGYTMPDVIVEERQANGTAAGAFTAATNTVRNLNTLVRNAGSIASLASNVVTLGAGTYFFKWSAPAVAVDQHQSWLQNVTDGIAAASGTSEYASSSGAAASRSEGSCVVTIAAAKAFQIFHRCTTTHAVNGLGVAASFALGEVYARLEITQLA